MSLIGLAALSPFPHRVTQDVFDLRVETAQLILGPPMEYVHQIRRQTQQKRLSINHTNHPIL
jgi:hypothetical protein